LNYYIHSKYEEERKKEQRDIYIADILVVMATDRRMNKDSPLYSQLIKPKKKKDKRTGDDIINNLKNRLGG
jgi:hypothetical protein